MTLNRDEVLAVAVQLRAHAEHFEQRDWDYTRNTGDLKHIRYGHDWWGRERPDRRLKFALEGLLSKLMLPEGNWQRDLLSDLPFWHRLGIFFYSLRTEKNLPNGQLDGGNIYTYWEEHGEYLQFVQPSVGSRVADLMEALPEEPAVIALAEEMRRIQERYADRIREGEVK